MILIEDYRESEEKAQRVKRDEETGRRGEED